MNNKNNFVIKLVKIFSRTSNNNDVKITSNKLTVSVDITKDEFNKFDSTCQYDIIVKKRKVYKMSNLSKKTKYTIDDVMNAVLGISNKLTVLEGEFHQFREETNNRLDKIEQRLDKVEQRLDKVEQRLDIHEKVLKKANLL